jgi:hypothetical protein
MIFYGLLALIVVWATHTIKRRFLQGTFRNIRGPSKQSWWSGKACVIGQTTSIAQQHFYPNVVGNLQQLIDPDCWAFHHRVTQDYGGVVKIHGLFGVRGFIYFDLH